jgi:hypothetical protein
VTEKRCNEGEERQQLELDVGAWESKRELEREGRRCSLLRVRCSPFIGAGECRGGSG